jgi:chemotaxis-related protein WspB
MLVLTFQIGKERLALDVRRIQEIVPYVRLQAVAGCPPWLAGIFIYRGQIVPVIDLHRLLGVGDCPVHLSTRIILVLHPLDGQERLVGLLAAKVADVREMQPPAPSAGYFGSPGRLSLGPVLMDGKEIIHLVELDRLLPGLPEEQLALVAKEPSA